MKIAIEERSLMLAMFMLLRARNWAEDQELKTNFQEAHDVLMEPLTAARVYGTGIVE